MTYEEVTEEEFPNPLDNIQTVRCTYPKQTRKVQLLDPGTCAIPNRYTITLDQWKKQNGNSVS